MPQEERAEKAITARESRTSWRTRRAGVIMPSLIGFDPLASLWTRWVIARPGSPSARPPEGSDPSDTGEGASEESVGGADASLALRSPVWSCWVELVVLVVPAGQNPGKISSWRLAKACS
jgi:hypothetical protein